MTQAVNSLFFNFPSKTKNYTMCFT